MVLIKDAESNRGKSIISPMTWGVETNVVERFASSGVPAKNITCVKDTYVFNYLGSASNFLEQFRNFYGPTMNAFDSATKNGKAAELQNELEMLFNQQNQAKNNSKTTIPASFLRVTVNVP